MPREKSPTASVKARLSSGAHGMWGSPQWGRRLTDPDDVRRVETDSGSIDLATGLRNVDWVKTGNPSEDARIVARYRQLGYDVKDDSWRFVFTIDQAKYAARVDAGHQKALAAERPAKRKESDPELDKNDFTEEGAPISAAQLMAESA